jgi:hypothetical protein
MKAGSSALASEVQPCESHDLVVLLLDQQPEIRICSLQTLASLLLHNVRMHS